MTSPMRHSIDLISWLLLLTLAALWSLSFIFQEVALEELDPFTTVLGRVGCGAVVIWLYVLARGLPVPSSARIWVRFALLGLLTNVIPFSLIVWGQSHILGGEAAILNATTPIFTVLIGHFATQDDRLTRNRAIGILLGILGAAVMVGVETAGVGARVSWGYLAIIGASISYGFAAHAARRVAANIPGPGRSRLHADHEQHVDDPDRIAARRPAARLAPDLHPHRHPHPRSPVLGAGLYRLFRHPEAGGCHNPDAGDDDHSTRHADPRSGVSGRAVRGQ